MKTGIVLLNYNSFEDSKECIQSILISSGKEYKIILVDNASIDASYEKLKDEFNQNTEIKFLESQENLGFSGGCNIGISWALQQDYDYVLLLNNDTIVTPNFLEELILIGESDKNIGIVGGKTLFNDDRKSIWDAGGYISEKSFRGVRRREGSLGIDEVGEVGFVTCCLALVKKEVFSEIGLLPEAYFFGSEEWEFSLRAERIGFKLVYNPNCIIYHKVGRSHDYTSAKMLYNTYRNRILFVKRNFSKIHFIVFANVFLIQKLIQRTFKKGNLQNFECKESFYILKEAYLDSFRYNEVKKIHWDKF
jgi:GT2 family glycosyltransferase